MNTGRNMLAGTGDLRKKIMIAAAAVMALMVLFPPKVIAMTMMGETDSKAAGYVFLFSDPAATPFGANPLVTSSIVWWKLLLQLAIVAGAALFAMRYFERQSAAQ
jgi:hypothetical protein